MTWTNPWEGVTRHKAGELVFETKFTYDSLQRMLSDRDRIITEWVQLWRDGACRLCTSSNGYGNSTEHHWHRWCPTHGSEAKRLIDDHLRKDHGQVEWVIVRPSQSGYDDETVYGPATYEECELFLPSIDTPAWNHKPRMTAVRPTLAVSGAQATPHGSA